ncbi:hypothetical protein ACEN2D_02305 [Corynebacterium auriscanis]|uniref:hypothetical protein n=1 Tax=Corynebacterium auriscanis TaxID=99807 RepID=UPI003CECC177
MTPVTATGERITWGGSTADDPEYFRRGQVEEWDKRFRVKVGKAITQAGLNLPAANDDSFGLVGNGWSDHAVRVKEKGRWEYYSHPYHLTGDDLEQLAALQRAGWGVWINGSSIYYTGYAVCVHLKAPDGK